jgi:cation transport ATPase
MDRTTPARTTLSTGHPRLEEQVHEHLHISEHQAKANHDHSVEPVELVRIGLMALACLASWLGLWHYLADFDVIALVGTLVGGYPIFREALTNLVARRMTMELSMTLALAAALAIGEFFTALVIALFVLMAEVLEGLTVARGRGSIKELLNLMPRTAAVRRGGATHEVDAAEVQVGDVVVMKPGARLPVDGVVIAGSSFVDQATITGESLPIEKLAGSRVYAGTINQSGVLEVRTDGVGQDTARPAGGRYREVPQRRLHRPSWPL